MVDIFLPTVCHFCAGPTFPFWLFFAPGNQATLSVLVPQWRQLIWQPIPSSTTRGRGTSSRATSQCGAFRTLGTKNCSRRSRFKGGGLIGNLEHDKARTIAQFNLLDQELTRRAQRGTLATTMGIPGTASVGGDGQREPAKVEPTENGDSREPSPADCRGEGSGDGNRGSGNRARSGSKRCSGTTGSRGNACHDGVA